MAIDTGQEARIIAAFSRLRIIHRGLMYLAYIPVIFALYVRWNPEFTLGNLTWGPIFGMALGLGALLIALAFVLWRCPACNKFIGFKRYPVMCEHCKVSFVKNR